MNLNKVEWSAAQELLTKLGQLVSELQAFSGEEKLTPLFSSRLFVPKAPNSASAEPFPYPVRILPILHAAQKKIDHWIDSPPIKSKENLEKKETQPIVKGASSAPISRFKEPQEEGASPGSRKGRADAPIAAHVQGLVKQVRIAIQNLSTSTFIENPQLLPVQTVLRKLKPLVDALIEAIEQGTLDPHQEDYSSPFRNAVPQATRSPSVHKKDIPFHFNQENKPERDSKLRINGEKRSEEKAPKAVEKGRGEGKIIPDMTPDATVRRTEGSSSQSPQSRQDLPKTAPHQIDPAAKPDQKDAVKSDARGRSLEPIANHGPAAERNERNHEGISPLVPSAKNIPPSTPFAGSGSFSTFTKRKESEENVRLEKPPLPGAPYFPGTLPFPSRQIEKKKRKRLFNSSKEEEEGDSENSKR